MDSFQNLLDLVKQNAFQLLPQPFYDEIEAEICLEFFEEIHMVKGGRGYLLVIYFNDDLPFESLLLYVNNSEDEDMLMFADNLLLTFGHLIDFIDILERRKRRGAEQRWAVSIGYKSRFTH